MLARDDAGSGVQGNLFPIGELAEIMAQPRRKNANFLGDYVIITEGSTGLARVDATRF
jgi:hypothetical protein